MICVSAAYFTCVSDLRRYAGLILGGLILFYVKKLPKNIAVIKK